MRCCRLKEGTEMLYADPGIVGLFETKDGADAHAHAAYTTHKYCRAMAAVEYQAKENENR